jgi:hypothetical protein
MQAKLHDIYSLPLEKFIDCYFDKDYSLLIINGEPTEGEMQLAWNNILEDYNDSLRGHELDEINYWQRYITHLQLKCQAIDLIIYRLSIEFDFEIWKELSGHIEHDLTKINIENKDEFMRALNLAIMQKNIFLSDIEDKKAEVQELLAQQEGTSETISKKYFSKMIVVLSENNGYHLDRTKTTVYEFVEMILILKNKIERLESKYKN